MRPPRVRFTVGRWMIAVAIVALVFKLELWRRKIPYCQQQAIRCDSAQASHLWLAEKHEKIATLYRMASAH